MSGGLTPQRGRAGTHRWRDLSVACANLDGMTGGVQAEAARVDPAAGRRVGTGRGERLLRRVLAGTDLSGPSPSGPSPSGPAPSGEADGPLRHAVHLPP